MRKERRRRLPVLTLALAAVVSRAVTADPRPPARANPIEKPQADQVFERYLRDVEDRRGGSDGPVSFEIDASLPKLKKKGMMRGLKLITSAGKIAYTQLHFVGDELIKTAVIARFLKADSQQRAS